MKKEDKNINKSVMLNTIQYLRRLSLRNNNNVRGRFRIKYGMTSLLNTSAFTLIELLVVVLIIAILAAVALPQYQRAIDKANFTRADAVARQLAKHLEWYYLEHGSYPADWRNINFSYPGCTVKGNGVQCPDIKFAGKQINLTLAQNKKFIYFSADDYFRNNYYLLHEEQDHQGEWLCGPLGRSGRGARICKSLCGANSCYYK